MGREEEKGIKEGRKGRSWTEEYGEISVCVKIRKVTSTRV